MGALPTCNFRTTRMAYVMVDVESDGPIPGDYSMICFGAVLVDDALDQTFYGRLKPISEKWVPGALAVSGFSREETLAFAEPQEAMQDFERWLTRHAGRRAFFVSDNNGFDWQFINWYFWRYLGRILSGTRAQISARSTKDWSRIHSRTSSTCDELRTLIIPSTTPRRQGACRSPDRNEETRLINILVVVSAFDLGWRA